MKREIAVVVLTVCTALTPGLVSAKGCLKGAAVGAVGGHVAGGHSVLGAAAGCAVGRHEANKKQKAAKSSEGAAGSKAGDTGQPGKS